MELKPFKNWNNFTERGQKLLFVFSSKLALHSLRSTVVAGNFPLTETHKTHNMTADEILKKHEDENEMHFHEVDRSWIIQAMEEYAALQQNQTKDQD